MKKTGMAVAVMIFLFAFLVGCAQLPGNTIKQVAATAPEKEAPPPPVQAVMPAPEKQKMAAADDGLISIKGEIDAFDEIAIDDSVKGEMTLTKIGFKDGQGVIAKGIYPGLQKGKKVKLYLKQSEIIFRGTSTYIIYKIEGLP